LSVFDKSKRYADRAEAGRVLGAQMKERYAGREDVIVLALPRGGVPVGAELARAIGAALDVFVVRKLGAPDQPELALGAIASGGARVFNEEVVRYSSVSREDIEAVIDRERRELQRRERLYRGDRPWPELRDQIVIVADDGLATGATMRAAIAAVRQFEPLWIAAAVPVGAPETARMISELVDELICPLQPPSFQAVGVWYDDFAPTSDDEVCKLLSRN
jgi:putative phosphoribosyl transferase